MVQEDLSSPFPWEHSNVHADSNCSSQTTSEQRTGKQTAQRRLGKWEPPPLEEPLSAVVSGSLHLSGGPSSLYAGTWPTCKITTRCPGHTAWSLWPLNKGSRQGRQGMPHTTDLPASPGPHVLGAAPAQQASAQVLRVPTQLQHGFPKLPCIALYPYAKLSSAQDYFLYNKQNEDYVEKPKEP